MIRIFATSQGLILEREGAFLRPARPLTFDQIFSATDPQQMVAAALDDAHSTTAPQDSGLLAPLQNQEIWAAGVTYLRSKTARMEEARQAGGGDFYDKVYHGGAAPSCSSRPRHNGSSAPVAR